MRIILALFTSFIFGCGQDLNSNSFDELESKVVEIDTSTPAGVRLAKAYGVLKDNCMNCHSAYHSNWYDYNTDAKWLSDGVVLEGDFSGSDLISRLKNYGGDMPKGSSSISQAEVDSLQDWIDNI